LSNIFDNAATSRRIGHRIGDLSFIAFSILGLIFLGTLFYSLPHFVEIAQAAHLDVPLNESLLNHDYDIIRNAMLAGIATELVIALRERPDYATVDAKGVRPDNPPPTHGGEVP
jgi:hypothetical protein